MARKVSLPPQDVVAKWDEQKVIKWLKRVQLEDCIPAFENRHINGIKLLELTEQKLFSFQDMKIKHRGQISKCVNECKSQASNAKRIVGTIRQNKIKERASVLPVENGEYYDSDDDFNYWDSDFDEDFDDEPCEENIDPQTNTVNVPLEIKGEEIVNASTVENNNCSNTAQTRFIPKPPYVAVPTNLSSNQKSPPRTTLPRPPSKRPPSQPPPPPVPQTTVQPMPLVEGPIEQYEIPINHQGSSSGSPLLHTRDCDSTLSGASSHSDNMNLETYEVVEPVEENYEVIESPPIPVKSCERPVLPPRSLSSASFSSPPPPLPQKPKKFQDSATSERNDGLGSLSSPKLPLKHQEENDSSGVVGRGAFLINSILGRRNSTPAASSPQLPPRSRDINFTDASLSNRLHNTSDSSPERDGVVSVGSSSFIHVSHSGESVKNSSYSLSELDEVAQCMATRPLPPVPQPTPVESVDDECDVTSYPWFHEIERSNAEVEIKNLFEDGSFLVRPSKRAGKENPFTLTVLQDERVFHLNIRLRADGLFALGKEKIREKSFPSVAALISYHEKEHILLTSRGAAAGQTMLRLYPEKQTSSAQDGDSVPEENNM